MFGWFKKEKLTEEQKEAENLWKIAMAEVMVERLSRPLFSFPSRAERAFVDGMAAALGAHITDKILNGEWSKEQAAYFMQTGEMPEGAGNHD